MKIESVHEVTRLASVRENLITRRQLIAAGDVKVSVGGSGFWKPRPAVLAVIIAAEAAELVEVEEKLRSLGVTIDAEQPA